MPVRPVRFNAPTGKMIAVAGLGVALSATSAAVALANDESPTRFASAVVGVVVVAVPVGVGLYQWRLDPANRMGKLLILMGVGWFFATLTASADPLLYSTGRVAVWLVEPPLIYVTLAYPTGRLRQRSHRLIAGAAWVLNLGGFLPNAFLMKTFPVQPIWGTCYAECPPNFFAIDGINETAPVAAAVVRCLAILTIALFASVIVATWRRLQRGSPLMRRTLVPVLATLLLRYFVYVLFLVLRQAGVDAKDLVPLGFLIALTLPASALGFFAAQVFWRMQTSRVLETLTMKLHESTPSNADLQRILSDAVHDPTLEMRYAGDAQIPWCDTEGRPAALPNSAGGRCVIELPDAQNPLAAMMLDGAFTDQLRFVEAVGACAFGALDRRRLNSALQSTVDDLAASRARLVGTADSERRRIQRDLHDGLQQRLVMLRIRLGVAAESADNPEAGAPPTLEALGAEVEAIIDELRMVTRTIYPSLLTDAGVAEALNAVALRAPLPMSVDAEGLGRYPVEIESAVYFCCLEALQNALKHATGARHVRIVIRDDGRLRFEVIDDGCGFDPAVESDGAGLANMRDRIEVVGGHVAVLSERGVGTTVRGNIFVAAIG